MHRTLLATALSALSLLLAATSCQAPQAPVSVEIPLYEGPAPGSESWDWEEFRLDNTADGQTYVANVATPTLLPFLPEAGKATGAAMIVCPGGGHQILSYSAEGTNVAAWLAERGVAAFVLKYRLIHFAKTPEEAFWYVLGLPEPTADQADPEAAQAHRAEAIAMSNDDGRAAIAWVRRHAAEYGIDPQRIGIIGFSAGAGVTASVCFDHDAESRPDLVAPVYGGTFPGTLPEDAAPLFVVAPEIDQRPGLTGIGLYTAWQQAGLPAELHYFADCEHGFGYKSDGAPVNDWITLLYHFMQKTGFVPSNESK
ncbi:MAG: alpha/beta hydrolase fold domain-containing protein [Bacteroidales bacterium]|nr:alpha/beta hydrolase fold domain-containing protein [Bacteroidales bacterium]